MVTMDENSHKNEEQGSTPEGDVNSFSGKPALLETYLVQTASIEKNIDRRLATNRFNLSILTALAAVYGFTLSGDVAVPAKSQPTLLNGILLLVLLVSVSWFFQVLRYREVSRVKHEVAIGIESELGLSRVAEEDAKFRASSTGIEQTLSELILPIAVAVFSIWALAN